MSKVVSSFLITAIIVVGSFSLLTSVSHTHGDGYICPISAINGIIGECVLSDASYDDMAAAVYHLKGIQVLSNIGVISMSLILLLFAILVYIYSYALLIDRTLMFYFGTILNNIYAKWKETVYYSIQPFMKWFVRLNEYYYQYA